MRRLAIILLLTIAPVAVGAIALGAYLNFGSIRIIYISLVHSRFDQLANRIGSDIEVALSFGLPLAGQDTLTPLLSREQSNDPLLESIDVAEADGEVLFSSDPARIGAAIATLDGTVDVRSRIVANDFGVPVGSVVVRGSMVRIQRQLDGVAAAVERTAVITGIIAVLICAIVILVPLRAFYAQALGAARLADDGSEGADDQYGWAIAEVEAAHAAIAARLADRRGD
ncbi:hypothetical protein RUR49_18795 [Pseudoxanthobacter sp. M-2]|uniref:hypothetical protein n=1 Tax=Pseudoxanthobacter sp. M-2 TaxID=3078754 RepID=UPI0038FC5114